MPYAEPQDRSRRRFLGHTAALTIISAFAPGLAQAQQEEEADKIAADVIARAEELAGLEFTAEERELMRGSVTEHLGNLQAIRELKLPNEVPRVGKSQTVCRRPATRICSSHPFPIFPTGSTIESSRRRSSPGSRWTG